MTNTDMVEQLRTWYMDGDTGEEMVTDEMGSGAVLYKLDDGSLWVFRWDDQGFDYADPIYDRDEWTELTRDYLGCWLVLDREGE